jgi:O-antigen ligase
MLFCSIALIAFNIDKIINHKPVFEFKYTLLSVLFAFSFFLSMMFGPDYKDLTDFTVYNSTFRAVLLNALLFVPVNLALTYLIYLSISKIGDLLYYINVFLTSSLVVSIVSLLFGYTYDKENRLGMTFGDPNYLGRFVTFILILSIIYFLFNKKKNLVTTFFIILNFVLNFTILLFTFSRAALLTFVITFSIIILFSNSKVLKFSLIGMNFLVFSYVIAFVAVQRGLFVSEGSGILSSFMDLSNSTRLGLNYSSILMFLDYPIFGVGFHNFYNIYINYDYVTDLIPVSLSVSVVHSWFFSTLAEQGILGITTFCVLLYYIFKCLYKSIKNPVNEDFKYVSLSIFGLMFVFTFNGLFFPVFFPELLFPIFFGLTAGFLKLVKLSYKK